MEKDQAQVTTKVQGTVGSSNLDSDGSDNLKLEGKGKGNGKGNGKGKGKGKEKEKEKEEVKVKGEGEGEGKKGKGRKGDHSWNFLPLGNAALFSSVAVLLLAAVLAVKWEDLQSKGYMRYWWDHAPPPPPPLPIHERTKDNSVSVCFELRPNGDGIPTHNVGIPVCANDFRDVDDLLEKMCPKVIGTASKEESNSNMDSHVRNNVCLGPNGAKLITSTGVRVMSFADIEPGEYVYVVEQGAHFVWPLVKVGNVIYPRSVQGPVQNKPIRLVQLSESPRVFQIDNFVDQTEIDEIVEKNKKRLTPSEVGFAGWKDDTRTSSTSWDFHSQAAKSLQARAFDLLAMDRDPQLSDALQVLKYEPGQWYKPHTDYFDGKGFDGHDPSVNNGTNRFATVFVYFSDVEEGGHTVFPHSTSHEGYNGEKLVHDGTIKTAGYIDTKEAKYCCNTSSTALRSPSVKGNAVLFYSQKPGGELDPASLHGGCPPIKGEKWSGNIWIWTRPKPDKSKAKDAANKKKDDGGFDLSFLNKMENTIQLVWDPNFGEPGDQEFVVQYDLDPGMRRPMHTFPGHIFYALDPTSKQKLHTYEASKKDSDSIIEIKKTAT